MARQKSLTPNVYMGFRIPADLAAQFRASCADPIFPDKVNQGEMSKIVTKLIKEHLKKGEQS
jgi:hypothetical protein